MPFNECKHFDGRIENPRVGGSIPPQATSQINGLQVLEHGKPFCFVSFLCNRAEKTRPGNRAGQPHVQAAPPVFISRQRPKSLA